MRFERWVLFGAMLLGLAPCNARAYGPLGSGYLAPWWAAPRVYTQEYIPYFAQHPPVYYSRPIARPYGYVPYAYWPGRPAPQVVVTQPVVVRNHYLAGDAVDRLAEEAAPAGRRIVNPFAREPEALLPVPDEGSLIEPDA